MKTVRELIRRSPVWVSPDHTADAAAVLLRGYHFGALPVLENGRLVGMVSSADLLGADMERPVADFMARDVASIAPAATAREAADLMARTSIGRLAVVEQDRLVGVITRGDVLPEVGRSYDPLTGLPWTNSLHEWAIDHFRRGTEVTVLFLDLDDFGRFNKVYGHVVGDDVLKAVASTITAVIDPSSDFACRYGGDEFCICTLRTASEAAELAGRLRRQIREVEVPSLEGRHISCTSGQFGGMRTREREHVHFAATINNLINLASRDCTRNKPGSAAAAGTAAPAGRAWRSGADAASARVTDPTTQPRAVLDAVELVRTPEGTVARVTVTLNAPLAAGPEWARAPRTSIGTTPPCQDPGALPGLAADAAAAAVSALLPGAQTLTVSELSSTTLPNGTTAITVVADLASRGASEPMVGSALQRDDPVRPAVEALLAAVNAALPSFP